MFKASGRADARLNKLFSKGLNPMKPQDFRKRALEAGSALRVLAMVGAGFAASGLAFAPAAAQDVTTDESVATEVEDTGTIVVVGSRVARVNVDTPNPVTVFGEEEIQATGAATLEDFLFESNIAGPAIFNEAATLSQVGGSSFFDSRGFGTGYTLVLLNGRRLPSTPTTGEAATDLNQLPLAAVERVEFLSSGASAIYGSDAISGVINIVTKRRFDGISVRGRVGQSDEGDGHQQRASVVAGTSSDRGSALVTAEIFHQNAVSATARPLINSAVNEELGDDGRSPAGYPGTLIRSDFSEAVPYANCPESSIRPTTVVTFGTECAFDVAPLYQVFPDSTRFAGSAFAEYDLTDNLNVWGDLRYSRVETEIRNGAAPALFEVDASAVPASFMPADWVGDETVYVYRRIVDAGPRSRDQTNSTFVVAGGADYEWTEGHNLQGYYQHSWVDNNSVGPSGQISSSALSAAVNDGSFNLFDLNPQSVIDQITVSTFRVATLKEQVVNLSANGFIPFLGGRELGYAVGGEVREESYVDRVDAASESGDVAGGAASTGEGSKKTRAAFAELVYSPFDMLELQGALRYDTIDGRDGKLGDKLTYQIAGSLRPIEAVMLRANYGTGFKAPSLGELYLGRSFGVLRAVDRRACDEATTPEEELVACALREIRSVSGGNPELEPEESTYYGFGAVVEPFSGLRLGADYWNIEVDGKVGALGIQEILNNEDQYPHLVNRVGGRLVDPDAFVQTNLQNLTTEMGEGIDFTLGYNAPLTDAVSLILDWRASYLMSFKRQTSAIQPLCDEAGTTSEPEWRANGRVGLVAGALNTNVTARYIGKTEDQPGGRISGSCELAAPDDVVQVDDYLQFDWNLGYQLSEKMDVVFGVRNVFDKAPSASISAAGGWPYYDQALYDNMGRFFYLELGFDF
jgi:iron complex outermembrane receptor protein